MSGRSGQAPAEPAPERVRVYMHVPPERGREPAVTAARTAAGLDGWALRRAWLRVRLDALRRP